MTSYEIKAPQTLDADIMLPASKSISNRALIIHALAGSDTMPRNLSDCDDTRVVLQALNNRPEVIDIGAAGNGRHAHAHRFRPHEAPSHRYSS